MPSCGAEGARGLVGSARALCARVKGQPNAWHGPMECASAQHSRCDVRRDLKGSGRLRTAAQTGAPVPSCGAGGAQGLIESARALCARAKGQSNAWHSPMECVSAQQHSQKEREKGRTAAPTVRTERGFVLFLWHMSPCQFRRAHAHASNMHHCNVCFRVYNPTHGTVPQKCTRCAG